MTTAQITLGSLPFMDRLAPCRRILLSGMGGGFDFMVGLPLYLHLRGKGKQVFLASLSFSDFSAATGRKKPNFVEVSKDTPGNADYFPEKYLAQWFAERDDVVPVYCFEPAGARAILEVFRELSKKLEIDALVLVDGGTDSLMRGDEPGLGTPAEDMASLAAANQLDLPVRLMANLGFGVDTFHGVCHAYVLEAIADLTEKGAFLGAFSMLPGMAEFQAYKEALEYVNKRMPAHKSIVQTSIVAAGMGRFGDYHSTTRTRGSQLFINPLMSMYWCFEVDGVARRCLYLDYLRDTYSRWDIQRAINNYLYTITPRKWIEIPL